MSEHVPHTGPGHAAGDPVATARVARRRDEAERVAHDAGVAERAWREGYYTGKRDYAGSVMGGTAISTPNPYTARIARGEGDAHRPERCPTCGCELAYPTAVHVVDCGEGSE